MKEHKAARNKSTMIINIACCVCYGMHNEFGQSRPVGELQEDVNTGMLRVKVR